MGGNDTAQGASSQRAEAEAAVMVGGAVGVDRHVSSTTLKMHSVLVCGGAGGDDKENGVSSSVLYNLCVLMVKSRTVPRYCFNELLNNLYVLVASG